MHPQSSWSAFEPLDSERAATTHEQGCWRKTPEYVLAFTLIRCTYMHFCWRVSVGAEHAPPCHKQSMKSPNGGVGSEPMKECCGKMGQRNSHQPQQTFQLTCMRYWILDSKQGSTTRRSSCVQLLMLEYSWSLDTYGHLSWTPVSTFKLDIESPNHFRLRDIQTSFRL